MHRLKVGESVRLCSDGAVWRVERVNECGATIRSLGGEKTGTREVEFRSGRTAKFSVYAGAQPGAWLTISNCSHVERVAGKGAA